MTHNKIKIFYLKQKLRMILLKKLTKFPKRTMMLFFFSSQRLNVWVKNLGCTIKIMTTNRSVFISLVDLLMTYYPILIKQNQLTKRN